YNEEAVLKNMASKNQSGISVQNIDDSKNISLDSMLKNWPVQIKLAPVKAPYFDKADLLIAADCCAYAYGDFHREFIRNKITLIGCPKLDMIDYSEKLAEIIKSNDINSITLTRMEVPCCGGLEYAVNAAIKESGKNISLKVITVCIDGNLK
ncbi:MAG: 4Fe-4S ferredoxin, partial [Anaerovoracaceae bacterium]